MKNTLKNFEMEISEKDFENFDGFDADGFDADGYDAEGYDMDGYDAEGYDMDGNYDESYDDFNGGQTLPLSEQTIDVTVTNSTAAPLPAKLFAGNRNGLIANYNNPVGIIVTSNNSVAGYGQLVETLKSAPMIVTGMIIFVTNASQLSNQIDFIEYQAGGSENKQPFRPSSRRSSKDQQANIIEAKGLKFTISGNHEMSFVINANELVTFTLFITNKVDLTNLNRGRSAVEKKRKPKRRRRRG